ncbi:MAG: hypothetical protein IJQ12_02540 [Lachnospiraceae bacterium]|nr:hypothetical protein [Lachnospiraceae bacterium]
MKTFLKGFIAAVCGIALFIALLIVWLEMTGMGYGIFARASEEEETATEITTDAGTDGVSDTGTGATAGYDRTVTRDTPYALLSLLPYPRNAGEGTGAGSGNGTGSGAGNAGTGAGNTSGAGTTAGGAGASDGAGATSGGAGSSGNAGGSASSAGDTSGETDEYTQRAEGLRDQIERELRAINGEKVTVDYDRNTKTFTISYPEEGLIASLSRGATNDAIMRMWEERKEKAEGISKSYHDRLAAYDLDDAHVIVNLLNDENSEQIFLSYSDGTLRHDGLPLTHLQNQRTDPVGESN